MQNTWIFQLRHPISAAHRSNLLTALSALMADWKAHGTPVPGQAKVVRDRFIVVQAQPGSTSGCSIDSMTQGIDSILDAMGMALLPPNEVFYLNPEGDLAHIDFRKVKEALAEGRMHADTVVFDSTMGQSNDLNRWEMPLRETWLARFLPETA